MEFFQPLPQPDPRPGRSRAQGLFPMSLVAGCDVTICRDRCEEADPILTELLFSSRDGERTFRNLLSFQDISVLPSSGTRFA